MSLTLGLCVFVPPDAYFVPTSLQFLAGSFDDVLVLQCRHDDHTQPSEVYSNIRILDHEWADSFASARNSALDALETDFVFVMEHHEKLNGAMVAGLRSLIELEEPQQIHCVLIEVETPDGRIIETRFEPRLWCSKGQYRYRGRAFETLNYPESTVFKYHDDIQIRQASSFGTDEEVLASHQRKMSLLERQLEETPDDRHTRYQVAVALFQNGQFDDALGFLSELVADGRGDHLRLSASVWLVECLRCLGRARDAFDRGLTLISEAPDYGELWYAIGKAALESEQRIKAEAAFRSATKVYSTPTPDLFQDLAIRGYRADLGQAQALASLRDSTAAERLLAQLRQRLPENVLHQVDEDFVRIYLQLDQATKAWDILEYWLKRDARWIVNPLLVYLSYVFQMQGASKAYDFFRSALAAYEGLLESLSLVTVGIELAAQVNDGRSEEDLLRLAVQLGSQEPSHYKRLARIDVERGDLDSAQHMAQKARELDRQK